MLECTTPPIALYGLQPMTLQERLDWLRLSRSENVGPRTFFELIRYFGTAKEALHQLPELARQGGRKKPLAVLPVGEAERELEALHKFGGSLIAAPEPAYPKLLRHIVGHPPLLSIFGNPSIFERPAIAMVGARNASLNSCRFASVLASHIGKEGMVIVSGLARGIDTHAHMASIESGTIAVVAGGIDKIYPPENQRLFYDIAKAGGAIVAEMPFASPPKSQHFPLRNRIISGLSYGVVIVEAALQSGSLITARYALEQNRELFAVPGFPGDPRARGTNDLLKKGAIVTTSAEDILQVIYPILEKSPLENHCEETFYLPEEKLFKEEDTTLASARPQLLALLSASPIEVNTLIATTGFTVSLVMRILLELELAGRLYRLPGNQVALIMSDFE